MTYPDWQNTIRQAQAIEHEKQQQIEDEKALKQKDVDSYNAQKLVEALSYLGVSVPRVTDATVQLDDYQITISMPYYKGGFNYAMLDQSDDGELVTFELVIRITKPQPWNDEYTPSFWRNEDNIQVAFTNVPTSPKTEKERISLQRAQACFADTLDALEINYQENMENWEKVKRKEEEIEAKSDADLIDLIARELIERGYITG